MITVDDLIRMSTIEDIRVSTRGDIAFTVFRGDPDTNKVLNEIHILWRNGGGGSAFLVGEKDSTPRWGPSGLLAFSSRRGGADGSGIFIWGGSGEPRRLAWFKHGIYELGWIDESRLMVTTAESIHRLYYDEDGDYMTTDRLPLWFDGRGLVAGLGSALYSVDVGSGKCEKLELKDGICCPEICNGSIYYAIPMDWRTPFIHRLMRLDMNSGEKDVVLEGYSVGSIKCLGGRLYTLMHERERGLSSHYKLWTIHDGSPECLSCGLLDMNLHIIAGDLDGGIVVTYADAGSMPLAVLKGGSLEVLDGERAWVHIAHAASGLVAYVMSSAARPQELYVYEGGEGRRITGLNRRLVDHAKLVDPIDEKVKVEDEIVDGWVMLPEGDGPHPLILYIHGGPKSMYGYRFHPEMQLMVSEGFAVAYANPRGSDGYSEEFADIRGKLGDLDYEQLMAFVDGVLEKYPVDPERLAVTGISYGGYMTNIIVTRTTRFKAAVSENGIADWILDYWTSDIGYWFNPDYFTGTPDTRLDDYIKSSPAFHVDYVETPMLIIHSMQDYRCTIDQSLTMHTALTTKGKESTLIAFKKGGHVHSLRAEPRHRRKRYEIKVKWLKEKLRMER